MQSLSFTEIAAERLSGRTLREFGRLTFPADGHLASGGLAKFEARVIGLQILNPDMGRVEAGRIARLRRCQAPGWPMTVTPGCSRSTSASCGPR